MSLLGRIIAFIIAYFIIRSILEPSSISSLINEITSFTTELINFIFSLIVGLFSYFSHLTDYDSESNLPQNFAPSPTPYPTQQSKIIMTLEDYLKAKESIVYIRYDVTGCCDYYGQISSQLGGSGSGVILSKRDGIVYVLTSRHVINCVFSETCRYPSSEKIIIRTQDGKIYTPIKVLYAPQNLDLAILQFRTNNNLKTVKLISGDYKIGDRVVAIGYPVFGVESSEPILQFSVTEGRITKVYDLLTYQGLSFKAIQSDALTDHGSSGGGLFNLKGELIGIITWGDRDQKLTIAIDAGILSDLREFETCSSGYPHPFSDKCCEYGTIPGDDGKCHKPCGEPYIYCKEGTCCNGKCVICPPGYYLTVDCRCY